MKKFLALALALMMILALAACGDTAAEAPAEAAAPVEDAAPAEAPAEAPAGDAAPANDSAPGDASGEMGDASGEMGDASNEMGDASAEDNGPVEQFDMVVNAPVIGAGATEVFAVGGDANKVDVDFYWTASNGDKVTLDSGTFQEGDYTLSVTFKAADGYELVDPVNVKLVGAVGTEYQPVSSSGVDGGVPVFEMIDVVTIAAGEGSSSGEPSA